MNSIVKFEAKYIHDTLITGVFFDNDDVLYRAPKDDQDYHQVAAVRAVQQQFPDMADKQLLRLLEKSQESGKGSLDIFVDRFDADPQKLRKDHYKNLIKLTKEFPQFFEEDESAYGDIAQLRIAGINTHIITHGNPEWTEYTTSQNERALSDFFQNKNYTTKDEMPNHSGKNRTDIYEYALNKMGATQNPTEKRGKGFAMIEDTMKNLQAAKELGMMTILINRAELPAKDIADYVDITVNTSQEAVQAILLSNAHLERQTSFTLSSLDT